MLLSADSTITFLTKHDLETKCQTTLGTIFRSLQNIKILLPRIVKHWPNVMKGKTLVCSKFKNN